MSCSRNVVTSCRCLLFVFGAASQPGTPGSYRSWRKGKLMLRFCGGEPLVVSTREWWAKKRNYKWNPMTMIVQVLQVVTNHSVLQELRKHGRQWVWNPPCICAISWDFVTHQLTISFHLLYPFTSFLEHEVPVGCLVIRVGKWVS